jgi:hypothetical protein
LILAWESLVVVMADLVQAELLALSCSVLGAVI